jgi:hypothetical protein
MAFSIGEISPKSEMKNEKKGDFIDFQLPEVRKKVKISRFL